MREKMFRKHRHRMLPVAVSDTRHHGTMADTLGAGQPYMTAVLFRCEEVQGPACIEAKILSGLWDLHDLGGMPASWPDELKDPVDSTSPPAGHQQVLPKSPEQPS